MQPHWFPKKDVKIEPVLYEGTASEVLDLVDSTDDVFESIALFFHNPTITHLNQLLSGSMTVHFPTCAISCLKFDGNHWNELEVASCSLINFDFPKRIKTNDLFERESLQPLLQSESFHNLDVTPDSLITTNNIRHSYEFINEFSHFFTCTNIEFAFRERITFWLSAGLIR